MSEFSNFLEVQTKTAWGRTLSDFADWCQPPAGILALDLGSGPGLLPAIFADRYGIQAIALDADLGLLRSAPEHISSTQSSAYALPFPSASFEMVTATNVIFLLGDPLRALKECHRILKRDGTLILLNPSENLSTVSATELADARGLIGTNRESLLGWAARADKHGGWSEDHAKKLLGRAKFRVTDTTLKVGPGFARLTRAVKA